MYTSDQCCRFAKTFTPTDDELFVVRIQPILKGVSPMVAASIRPDVDPVLSNSSGNIQMCCAQASQQSYHPFDQQYLQSH
jgi:hypothetical protein